LLIIIINRSKNCTMASVVVVTS